MGHSATIAGDGDLPVGTPGAPVLLCCAGEDRFALAPAVERLARESITVDIVSGVEFDPTRLEAAIKRHGKRALYVLCRSDRLDRFKLTRLQLMLKREGLLDSRVLPVQLLAERPESISNPVLERIRQTPQAAGPSARDAGPPPRPPSAPADADEEDNAATIPVRLSNILNANEPASTPNLASPSLPSPAPSPFPQPLDDDLEAELTQFRTSNRSTMIIAGVGAALLLTIGAVLAFASEEETTPFANAETETETEAEPPPEAPPAAEPIPAAEIEPVPELEAEPAPQPVPAPQPGPVPQPVPVPQPGPAPEIEPVPELEANPAPPPPQPGTFELTPAEEHAAMMEALRSRRVRAFDLVVYVPKVSRYGTVARATKYCDEMVIEGLQGWRLPSASELRSLLEAGLISRSRYWTNQSVGERKHILLEGRNKRAAAKKTTYKGGRALCVRDESRHATAGEAEQDP